MKNDLSYHNLSVEDDTMLALDRTGHSGGYWQQAELCTEIDSSRKVMIMMFVVL